MNEGVCGQGVGGGAYIADAATVCASAQTVISGNDASTKDDDVFGMLLTL